jgi:hypothetical protein
MKLFLRVLGWTLIIAVVLFAGLLTAAHWVKSRDSDEEIAEKFRDAPIHPVARGAFRPWRT